ncbi:MAG: hypothetical protein D6741_21060 [Planctomycetota bacterium]|nr:MAG: hypothetical protein D6741_21060 [Planctomycetota bacterium]
MSHVVQLLLSLAILGILIIVAVRFLKKIRAEPAQNDSSVEDLLTNLEELRASGQLEEAEFRTIRTKLIERLRRERRNEERTG